MILHTRFKHILVFSGVLTIYTMCLYKADR